MKISQNSAWVLSLALTLSFPALPQAQLATALDHFTIHDGLKASLWADNDLLDSPVAIDADAQGRLWVVEDLSKSGKKGQPHARIAILSDTDGDGKADHRSEFGPTFGSKPLGIAVFDNVIVVSMAPKIYAYTDVNRDDVFDPAVDKEVILAEGFHGSNPRPRPPRRGSRP